MKMTRNKSKPMLTRAGIEIANAKSRVRIPRAPFTNRKIRPTRTTRITLKMVGENVKICLTNSSKIIPSSDK